MSLNSYKDLTVWKKAYDLTKLVYQIQLPQMEIYALQSQMRRASVSIISNIAEGSSRKTRKDYAHFLCLSYGSASELETQLFLCRDLYSLSIQSHLELLEEVSKMLRVMIIKLEPRS